MDWIFPLHNKVKHYPWGSPRWIPELLGRANPSGEPWAELWMGAHPGGPSELSWEGEGMTLGELIRRDPVRWLGPEIAASFGSLPFLFKALAAEQPLSIQAHPNLEQARAGWERENREGLSPEDPRRNYKDPSHKPEILCALGPFTALCGFRQPAAIGRLLDAFLAKAKPPLKGAFAPLLEALNGGGEKALEIFLRLLFGLDSGAREALGDHAGREEPDLAAKVPEERAVWALAARLGEQYPGDPGIIAPLYLNLITLAAGEAIYLPAGILHAYVHGFGVELMANSDNVLRGGLSSKHIDIPELCRILRFSPFRPEILGPGKTPPDREAPFCYPGSCREFALTVMRGRGAPLPFPAGGPALVLVTRGRVLFQRGREEAALGRGESAFIPNAVSGAAARGLLLSGDYTLHIAAPGGAAAPGSAAPP